MDKDRLGAWISEVFQRHYDAHYNQFHYTGFQTDSQIQRRHEELKASVLKCVFEAVDERPANMVKVIGKDEQHVHRATCKNCASILEYTRQEVKSYVHHDYGGGSDTYYYIDCPVCGGQVSSVSK